MNTTTIKKTFRPKTGGVNQIAEQARSGSLKQKPRTATVESLKPAWLSYMEDMDRAGNTVLMAGHTLDKWSSDMHVEGLHPSRVTMRHVDEWVNPVDSELTKATRAARLSFLRGFFRWFVGNHPGSKDPTNGVHVRLKLLTHRQKEGREVHTFTEAQMQKILAELGKSIELAEGIEEQAKWTFWYIATVLGRYAGLRISDICLLERASVDDKPGKIVVWTRKRQVRVALPIKGKIMADAIGMIPLPRTAAEKVYCFPEWREVWSDASRRCNLSQFYHRFLMACGIKGGQSFHSLRSTYASEAWKAGVPTPHISRDLGHANESTTRRYIDYAE